MDNHAQYIEKERNFTVTNPLQVQIVFVGSKTHFPDCLSRTIAAEIDGCQARRVSGLADLALAMADEGLRPQLVIVDDSLWPATDADVVQIARDNPQVTIAIAFRDVARVNRVVLASAGLPKGISFLPMDLNIESWLTILRLLLTGYPFVPSEIMLAHEKTVALHVPPPAEPPHGAFDKLTPREQQVLALVAEGLQNKHIAERLGLSEHTVKLHLHHVISKLGARNRTDAALRYRRQSGS
jgi:DNA-binding NarL/FixJ family response regulator